MRYHITWIEVKSPEWKVCSLKPENGELITEVSINKLDKKTGQVAFPNWEAITLEADVEGEFWTSPKGNKYLFAPKPQKSGGNRTAQMEKMMDKKSSQIAAAQDTKEHSIRLSSTMRDAVLITTTIIANDPILSKDSNTIKKMIKDWRNWLMTNWDMTTDDYSPFPEPIIDIDDINAELSN